MDVEQKKQCYQVRNTDDKFNVCRYNMDFLLSVRILVLLYLDKSWQITCDLR